MQFRFLTGHNFLFVLGASYRRVGACATNFYYNHVIDTPQCLARAPKIAVRPAH